MNKKGKYAKLVSSLRAKGAYDPRALAASIGRKNLGRQSFSVALLPVEPQQTE